MSRHVAVVVPAYDAARFLPATLASVRAQTRPADEIIVVDDGSRDETAAVAERLGARVLRQANLGPGAARNTGVRAARSEWIAFLDADDLFEPEKLARQLAHVASTDAIACCTNAWVLRDGKKERHKLAPGMAPALITRERLLAGNPIVASSMLVRRDAIERAGMFDEDPVLIATEDYDLWLRIAALGGIAYLDEPLCCYRTGEPSLASNERFLAGIDRIMAKQNEPRARVRISVRLDAAFDRLARGDRRGARALLREARALGGGGTKAWKLWVRSFL